MGKDWGKAEDRGARRQWDLFVTFLIMGFTTFGGGYAILPVIQREIIDKRGWIDETELADYYAIGQAAPGINATNTATFVGHRCGGNLGGIIAALAFTLPSFLIISIVAMILGNFYDYPIVKSAFVGIRVAVCILISNTVISLWRVSIVGALGLVIFLVALVLSVFSPISPVFIVIAAGIVGIVAQSLRARFGSPQDGDEGDEE